MSSTKSKPQSIRPSRFKFLKRVLLAIAGSGILSAIIAAGIVYHNLSKMHQEVDLSESLLFEVENGQSLSRVAHRLESEGVIQSAFWFYWVGRYQHLDKELKAGEYWVLPNISEMELYPLLASGKTASYTIRFIEGWNLKDVMAELDRHPKLVRKIESSDPLDIARILGMKYPHAEGMIFPDTYSYQKGMSDRDILLIAYHKLLDITEELWQQKSGDAVVKTPYEALILASIVEKETGAEEERGQVAGVFSLRLQKRMRLQTDPTVIYGLGDQYKGNITRAHLRQATPYNTYVIKGLPPTPIAMPGRASIAAALDPEISGYL